MKGSTGGALLPRPGSGGSRGDVLGWVWVRRQGREEGMEGSLQFQVRQEGNLEF